MKSKQPITEPFNDPSRVPSVAVECLLLAEQMMPLIDKLQDFQDRVEKRYNDLEAISDQDFADRLRLVFNDLWSAAGFAIQNRNVSRRRKKHRDGLIESSPPAAGLIARLLALRPRR